MEKIRAEFKRDVKRKLLKAISHLEYSYNKICSLSENISEADEEALETWESFAARFSRVTDIFLKSYLRIIVLEDDPGYQGSFRDFINQGEKLRLINNADDWMFIRGLRNISAHEYTEEEIGLFYKSMKTECPKLIEIKAKL